MVGRILHLLVQTTQKEMSLLETVAFGETRDQGTQAGLCKMFYQHFTAPTSEVSMGYAPTLLTLITHLPSRTDAEGSHSYHDSSSSMEESKKQSFIFFKDMLCFSYAQTTPLPGFFLSAKVFNTSFAISPCHAEISFPTHLLLKCSWIVCCSGIS